MAGFNAWIWLINFPDWDPRGNGWERVDGGHFYGCMHAFSQHQHYLTKVYYSCSVVTLEAERQKRLCLSPLPRLDQHNFWWYSKASKRFVGQFYQPHPILRKRVFHIADHVFTLGKALKQIYWKNETIYTCS